MKNLFFILLVFHYINVDAQKTFAIKYRQPMELPVSFSKEHIELNFYSRLVFNDAASYFYFIGEDKNDDFKNIKTIGDKLLQNSVLYVPEKNQVFHERVLTDKSFLLVEDTVMDRKWTYFSNTKNILGYACNMAQSVNKKNDTLQVWYASNIDVPYGPFNYLGLSGLVLQVADQESNFYLEAEKIEETNVQIQQPKNIKIVPQKDFLEPLNNLKPQINIITTSSINCF